MSILDVRKARPNVVSTHLPQEIKFKMASINGKLRELLFAFNSRKFNSLT